MTKIKMTHRLTGQVQIELVRNDRAWEALNHYRNSPNFEDVRFVI